MQKAEKKRKKPFTPVDIHILCPDVLRCKAYAKRRLSAFKQTAGAHCLSHHAQFKTAGAEKP